MTILRLLSWFLGLYIKLSTWYFHLIASLSINITKLITPEIQVFLEFSFTNPHIQLVTKPYWFSFPPLDTLTVYHFPILVQACYLILSLIPYNWHIAAKQTL